MTELQNDRLLKALMRQPTDRTPIWIMRQAGRYLPEYRATRARAGSFVKLMKTPELACEVTIQPLERYRLDGAILFSDILTIPDAMGCTLSFDSGLQLANPLRSAADIDRLGVIDPETELTYVMNAVRLIRQTLAGRVPLIGFAGSPWTLATYMVEGGPSKDFARIKALLFDDPAAAHRLLAILADSVSAYLNAQMAAGAQAVMIFDTWGGVLSPTHYQEFSLAYMGKIVNDLNRHAEGRPVPVVLFSKGASAWLEAIADTGCDALGVDWGIALEEARARVGARVALQGNLEPAALLAGEQSLRREVARVLASYGEGSGHVFNLGHGITPAVDPERVAVLVDAVHELSPAYHPAIAQ